MNLIVHFFLWQLILSNCHWFGRPWFACSSKSISNTNFVVVMIIIYIQNCSKKNSPISLFSDFSKVTTMFELKSIFLILATVTLVFCYSEYLGYTIHPLAERFFGKKANLIEFCNNIIFRHFVSSLISSFFILKELFDHFREHN